MFEIPERLVFPYNQYPPRGPRNKNNGAKPKIRYSQKPSPSAGVPDNQVIDMTNPRAKIPAFGITQIHGRWV